MIDGTKIIELLESGKLGRKPLGHGFAFMMREQGDHPDLIEAIWPNSRSNILAIPPDIMQRWLAVLLLLWNNGTEEKWSEQIRRTAQILGRVHVLTPRAWRRCDFACRSVALSEMYKYGTPEEQEACGTLISICNTVVADKADEESIKEEGFWDKAEGRISGMHSRSYEPDYPEWSKAAKWSWQATNWVAAAVSKEWVPAAVDRMIEAHLDAIEKEVRRVETT